MQLLVLLLDEKKASQQPASMRWTIIKIQTPARIGPRRAPAMEPFPERYAPLGDEPHGCDRREQNSTGYASAATAPEAPAAR
jgi:hypothetical protein